MTNTEIMHDAIELLTEAEKAMVNCYMSIAPHANYAAGNRFADKDETLIKIREFLDNCGVSDKESEIFNYLAQDANGVWLIFNNKPSFNTISGMWLSGENGDCYEYEAEKPGWLKPGQLWEVCYYPTNNEWDGRFWILVEEHEVN